MIEPKKKLKLKMTPIGRRIFKVLANRTFQQQMMMFILMLLFGIIVMNHIQSVRADTGSNNLIERYKQRQEDLDRYEESYANLMQENEKLNQQKEDAIAELLNRQGNEGLLIELKSIKVLAGFTEVRGPGITLVLDDKPGQVDSLDSIVHDGDINHALWLLKSVGAGAIAVNGLRITNSSYILCFGATILCNEQRLTPPFVITARGDPAKLAEVIRNDQEFNIRQAAGIDLVVKVTEENEVVIPPFAEADDISKYIDRLEVVAP